MNSSINPFVGKPIRSLQSFLRRISQSDPDIPPVIPDGSFTEQTRDAVLAFQRKQGLPATGSVDHETWDSIVIAYDAIIRSEGKPLRINLYPGAFFRAAPGDQDINLYAILAVIKAISEFFPELGEADLGNTYTSRTEQVVKNLQSCYGIAEDGIITKAFWDRTTGLYSTVISQNRFQDPTKNRWKI